MVCERCKHDARFVERRPNTYTSLVGNIRLDRCYYHCFWHAKEHLVELAESLWPEDEPQRKAWLDEQCPRLKREGGVAVLAVLEALDVSTRSAAVQDAHRRHSGYFRNNVHRMDYPAYVASGWQIGSGPVESACGTIVGDRLKGSGMRWSKTGSHATCQLRAPFLSEPSQWTAFWKDHPN